ncbi:MAG: STAS domain-containing protein [Deltaproteobacteria bacterium]|nr:STAS domain-containing protein [Deltaproteobacteria bacterium]
MQQRPNEITLQKHGEVTLLDIRGDITAFSESFLNDAYRNSNTQGARKLILKFEDSAYINSGGIAVLIQVLVQTKRNNQQVGIAGLSEHFKKVFHMVGITKFAAIHPSIDDALKAMS